MLAALRRLRGTPLDVFGRTTERRTERQLIEAYRAAIEEVLVRMEQVGLDAVRDTGVALISAPFASNSDPSAIFMADACRPVPDVGRH